MANKKLSELKEYRNLLREINFINEEELNSSQQAWLERAKEILEKTADIKDATDDQVDATKDILKSLNGIITGSGKHRDIQKHIDTILKSQNDSVKGIADNMDDVNKKTKTLRDQWKQYMKEGTAGLEDQNNSFSMMDGLVGGIGMKMIRMVKAPMLAVAGGAALTAKLFANFNDRLDTTGRNFGTVAVEGLALQESTVNVKANMERIGKTLDEAQKMGKELGGAMQLTAEAAQSIGLAVYDTSEELGVSSDTIKTNFVNFRKIVGLTEEDAIHQQKITKYVMQQKGFTGSISGMMDEIAGSSGLLVGTSKDTLKNFIQTAVNAKTLGLELKDIEAIRTKMLDMEGAMKSGMKARMLLGVKLNTQELTRLSLLDKDDELQRSIFNQLQSQNLSQIDTRYEVGLLADATGLSAEKMQIFLNAIKEGRSFTDLTQESMAAAGDEAKRVQEELGGGQGAASASTQLSREMTAIQTLMTGDDGLGPAFKSLNTSIQAMADGLESAAKYMGQIRDILIVIGGLAAFKFFKGRPLPGLGNLSKAPKNVPKNVPLTKAGKPDKRFKVNKTPPKLSQTDKLKQSTKGTKTGKGLIALDAASAAYNVATSDDKLGTAMDEVSSRKYALGFTTAALALNASPLAAFPEEIVTLPLAYGLGSIADWVFGSGEDFIVRPGEKQIMKFNKDDLVIGGTNLGGAMGGGGGSVDYDQLANSMVKAMNENLHIEGEVANRKQINAVLTTGAF